MIELILIDVAVANVCYSNNVCEHMETTVLERVEEYYEQVLNIDLEFRKADNIQSDKFASIPIDTEFLVNLDKEYNTNGIELTMFHGKYSSLEHNFSDKIGLAWEYYSVTGVTPLHDIVHEDYYIDKKALVVAHEIAHLLNLPHVESNNNLMHFQGGDGSSVLTDEQINTAREAAYKLINN